MADSVPSITGLILAGGRGSRMGEVDKGLQVLNGKPQVADVLERLRFQVSQVPINANRHAPDYESFGCPVIANADDPFSGQLAGLLAGLRHTQTEWLLSEPCDSPNLPQDLAARLSSAVGDADIAVPVTRDGRSQPVFCLLRRSLCVDVGRDVGAGGRQVETWLMSQMHGLVPFEQSGDDESFVNANSQAELQGLERRHA